MLVRIVQPGRGARDDRDDVLERNLLLALRDLAQESTDVLAVHELHRVEVLAVLLTDVVNLDDVVVMKRGSQPRFIEEHLDELRVLCVLAVDPLDHDVAGESFDAGRRRKEDLGHTTARQMLENPVPTELLRYVDIPHIRIVWWRAKNCNMRRRQLNVGIRRRGAKTRGFPRRSPTPGSKASPRGLRKWSPDLAR